MKFFFFSAKLTFFKENKSTSASKISPLPSHGIKRKNSDCSESPSKSVKLSKPLKVLSADSPNVQSPTHDSSSREDEVQEVFSASSEEENPASAKPNQGRCCLMDRFVKKIPNKCIEEISSTNAEVDISPCSSSKTSIADSEIEKEAAIVVEESDNSDDEQTMSNSCTSKETAIDEYSRKNHFHTENIKEVPPKDVENDVEEKKKESEIVKSTSPIKINEANVVCSEVKECSIVLTPLKPVSSEKDNSEATPLSSVVESPITPASKNCTPTGMNPSTSGQKKGKKVWILFHCF